MEKQTKVGRCRITRETTIIQPPGSVGISGATCPSLPCLAPLVSKHTPPSTLALSCPSLATLPQVRAPLEKKLAEDPQFLSALAADIAALSAELAALGVAENGSA